jgi:pyruvate dehydrogenase E1 component beta subunit
MSETREIVFAQAIITALAEEMRRDERVIVYGEDVGAYGGVYGATRGLQKEFGEQRVMDTPISESAITGLALGAALLGMRPVAEIMYCDFLTQASDQLVNNAAKYRYMSGGQLSVPMVIRTPAGGGTGNAAQHSQNLEAWMCHVPGLKVVMPSTPADARGLLKSAIRDDNPVVFIEHKKLYRMKGSVPAEETLIPLSIADIKRPGKDVTLVSWSYTIHLCLEAAEKLAQEGIDVEIVDPRTLQPLDIDTIIRSVEKTGRLAIAHEAVTFGGFGAEIAAQVTERAVHLLKHHVVRVGAKFVPQPYSDPLETFVLPKVDDIIQAVKQTLD